MDAYQSFAQVYDLFMDNIPYSDWCNYLCTLLAEYQITDGLILDLGCGTGTLTELLAKQGYDMIGIDNSPEMLEIALDKKSISKLDILYLQQDMREFELYGTVHAVISICDSLNYILDYADLVQVFRLVNNYLDPDGYFIFDLNTQFKYEKLLADSTIAENRPEGSFIWENYYDSSNKINEYDLTLFIPNPSHKNCYYKYQETHYQKCYSLEEIQKALQEAGMEFITAYDAFTKTSPEKHSERIYVVAKEHGKYSVK